MTERIINLGSMVILPDGVVLSGEEAIEAKRRDELGKVASISVKHCENSEDKHNLQVVGKVKN